MFYLFHSLSPRSLSTALPRLALCSGLLALGFGLAAGPALGQGQELTLGSAADPSLSGTLTYGTAGGTVAGTYTYLDSGGNPAPLPPGPDTVQAVDAYGGSAVSVSGGTLSFLNTYNTSTANFSGGTLTLGSDGNGYLTAADASTANVSGGSIRGLDSGGSSVVNVTDGTVHTVGVDGHSTLNVSGGSLGQTTISKDATANISGGNVGGSLFVFGTANVSGGTVHDMEVSIQSDAPGGLANISGGTVSLLNNGGTSVVNITGGIFTFIQGEGDSVYNLYGTDFLITPADPSEPPDPFAFHLTGILQNGDVLDAKYDDFGGTMVFHNDPPPVPEASTTVSLGLLLGLGGLVVWRKKKTASS